MEYEPWNRQRSRTDLEPVRTTRTTNTEGLGQTNTEGLGQSKHRRTRTDKHGRTRTVKTQTNSDRQTLKDSDTHGHKHEHTRSFNLCALRHKSKIERNVREITHFKEDGKNLIWDYISYRVQNSCFFDFQKIISRFWPKHFECGFLHLILNFTENHTYRVRKKFPDLIKMNLRPSAS